MPSTWTSKALWKAVLYVVVLNSISSIASHHLLQNAWASVAAEFFSDPALDEVHEPDATRTFYLKTLPRELVYSLFLVPLEYAWQCWLERKFPARPKGTSFEPSRPEEKASLDTNSNDEMEEEVMRRLIAKGKVRRASISWPNTLIKWLLDMVLVMFFLQPLTSILDEIVAFHSARRIWSALKMAWIGVPVLHIFTAQPLLKLFSFAVIPVQHRLPFESAVQMVCCVFLGTCLTVLVPWLTSKQFVQDIINNATQAAIAAKNETMNSTQVDLKFGEL